MPYSTVDQVASEFKNITFTATSSITIDEVTRFIDESDALINSMLAQIYVTPITGVNSLLIVQKISIYLASQRVKDIQQLKTGNGRTNQLENQARLDVKAMKMLKDIIDNNILLTDAVLLKQSGTFRSGNVSNNTQRVFKRDVHQW